MTSHDHGTPAGDPWADHRAFVEALAPIAPAGNVALRNALGWKQSGVFRRVRNTLIGMEVVRFDGGRGASRRLALGEHDFDTALQVGRDPQVGREIALYPLLTAPIDEMITAFHLEQGHPVTDNDWGDGVTPYITAAKRAGSQSGRLTRPDITVVVDLSYEYLGPWNDVHAVEVKPYWAVGRDGLFEAAAQAALQRCTHSWLIAYVPPAGSPGMGADQRELIRRALADLGTPERPGPLSVEAKKIGIGVAVATALRPDAALDVICTPRRQAMDPDAADELFASLKRRDGS